MDHTPVLTAAERSILLAVAARIVPASAFMTDADRATMLGLVNDTLSSRTSQMQRQFRLFLRVLRWAPFVRYLRPLDRLDGPRQDGALRWFQDHPFQVLRGGFWGVRTLVLLGFYGRPDIGPSIAYTPSSKGNAVLHARARR